MLNDAIKTLLHPRNAVICHDLFMVWAAWMAVHWLRYTFKIDAPELLFFTDEIVIVLVIQALVFHFMGLYRGIWRFASLPDLWNIIRSGIAGTMLISLALFLFNRLEGVPRSVFLLYPIALTLFLGGPRLLYRIWKDHHLAFHARVGQTRVLIIGAGMTADRLARDLKQSGPYFPIGFLDDRKDLQGAKLRGMPIYGGLDKLDQIVQSQSIEMAIIAIPSASNEQMQRIVKYCANAKVPFRTVPRLQDLVSGQISRQQIKDVAIEDLLGRDQASMDWESIRAGLAGKSVMVTGGGGSIGSELCRQIAHLNPATLIILENSEHNLYQIERDLSRLTDDLALEPILGDITDQVMVERVLEHFKPDVIFHAAAYKHVPLLQRNIREAVRNNVIGTQIMALAADRHQVSDFILISTDKAVNPVNILGATKRVAELFCENLASRSTTNFVTVRFGNVLNSAGSVVPLFNEQISQGGPITVTHPEVTRFFMTIPEACQLIMQVAASGEDGNIYVLEMGEPVRIRSLAEQMIRLAGKVPGQDIMIEYTGLREGEKLYEELFHESEPYKKTAHPQILLARHREMDWSTMSQKLAGLTHAVNNVDIESLESGLRSLVPEMKRWEQPGNVVNLRNL